MSKEGCSIDRLSDEELVLLCRNNDENAVAELISRFAPAIRSRAESFKGTLKDDLSQEGFLALLDAVRNYSPERGASFGTFAQHCIRNRMINVFKRVNTDFDELPDDLDKADENAVIPENFVIEQESLDELCLKIKNVLSDLELKVFRLYISGSSYQVISDKLGVSAKTVDNAVQRMRKKLRDVLR